tara:strand:+ start:58 stop:504 length:447 start_codon:yes stop_codon:yes gene_type:complete
MKGKIKSLVQLPSKENNQLGTLYPCLVALDNGDEIIVDKKSRNALQEGNYLEYRYKNNSIKYQGREYKTASDIGYQNKEYLKPANNYTKPQVATTQPTYTPSKHKYDTAQSILRQVSFKGVIELISTGKINISEAENYTNEFHNLLNK